jgi:hypothetical protein
MAKPSGSKLIERRKSGEADFRNPAWDRSKKT